MATLHTIKVPTETWQKFKTFANSRGLKLQAAVGFALAAYIAANSDKKK